METKTEPFLSFFRYSLTEKFHGIDLFESIGDFQFFIMMWKIPFLTFEHPIVFSIRKIYFLVRRNSKKSYIMSGWLVNALNFWDHLETVTINELHFKNYFEISEHCIVIILRYVIEIFKTAMPWHASHCLTLKKSMDFIQT